VQRHHEDTGPREQRQRQHQDREHVRSECGFHGVSVAGVLVVALHVSTIVLNTLDMIVELAAIT
jgi:hypothetical protein